MFNDEYYGFEYLFFTLYWSLVFIIIFQNSIFICIDGFSYKQSKTFLYVLVIASLIIGILITYKTQKNLFNVFINIFIPLGTYCIMTLYEYKSTYINVIGVIAIVITIIFGILIFFRHIKSRNKWFVIKKRLYAYFFSVRAIVGISMILILIPFELMIIQHRTLIKSDVPPTIPSVNKDIDEMVAENMNTNILFQDAEWEKINLTDKINKLQVLANIEAIRLGLPHELNVHIGAVDENIAGYYEDGRHLIVVDADYLKTATGMNLLSTICHEAYHAYEYRMLDLYDTLDENSKRLYAFQRAYYYRMNFENYIESEKSFEEYYSQECEIDARNYAEQSTIFYKEKIEKYLVMNIEEDRTHYELGY